MTLKKQDDLSEEELNERIDSMMDSNSLLIKEKDKNKDPKDKKPKPILS